MPASVPASVPVAGLFTEPPAPHPPMTKADKINKLHKILFITTSLTSLISDSNQKSDKGNPVSPTKDIVVGGGSLNQLRCLFRDDIKSAEVTKVA
jgi:hypothetical protein